MVEVSDFSDFQQSVGGGTGSSSSGTLDLHHQPDVDESTLERDLSQSSLNNGNTRGQRSNTITNSSNPAALTLEEDLFSMLPPSPTKSSNTMGSLSTHNNGDISQQLLIDLDSGFQNVSLNYTTSTYTSASSDTTATASSSAAAASTSLDINASSMAATTNVALETRDSFADRYAAARHPTSPTATEYHRHVVTRRTSAASLGSSHHDEFAEKMRTAAVMLAQLYQQQQKELAALTAHIPPPKAPPGYIHTPSSSLSNHHHPKRSSSLSTSSGGIGNKSAESLLLDQATSSPKYTPPGSPALGGRDKRKYQKLKSDFEVIRNRLVKEMTAMEERRMKMQSFSKQHQVQQQQQDSGAYQVEDDLLNEDQEKLMQSEAAKSTKDDPSGKYWRKE